MHIFSEFTGSPNPSNVNIGGVHISTGICRSGIIGGSGSSNHPNSLSQMIQFRTTQRSSNRRRCAYLNLNGRNANPPAILQRLLGPSVAQNVNIGLGQVIANANGSASFRDATRVVVMDNGFGIFANASEPSIDLFDQGGYLFGRSLAATLNSTPSPLHWWLEEAKILGLESQADVCLTVCNDLIPDLEAQRSLEISKTRSKRKKKSPGENSSTGSNVNQKQKNETSTSTTSNAASDATPVSRTNATISNNNENEAQAGDSTANRTSDATETNINLSTENTTREAEHEESYDSEEIDEIDDSEQVDEDDEDEDNSSKNDEDLEIEETNNLNENQNITDRNNDNDEENENDEEEEDEEEDDDGDEDEDDDENNDRIDSLPRLIRSYVESNEEMTESDCNIHEEESNQNDDEDNGGGSASDSGRSIASSVSTEPFFQVGQAQRQQQEQQQDVQSQSQQQPQPVHPVENSSAQQEAADQTTSQEVINNTKQELLSYDELCGINVDPQYVNNEKYLDSILPSIDVLQPLTIQLEQTLITPTTSTSRSDSGSNNFDEVQEILKVINTEFNESTEALPKDVELEEDNKDADNDDDDEDDEKEEILGGEGSQEAKRQRLEDSNDDSNQAQEIASISEQEQNIWQPRRRMLRGRRLVLRENGGQQNAEQDAGISELTTANTLAVSNLESTDEQTSNVDSSRTDEPVVGATPASTTATAENGSQSTSGSSQIPDGIDPSFLAALPEEMRAEVIAEHLRYVLYFLFFFIF